MNPLIINSSPNQAIRPAQSGIPTVYTIEGRAALHAYDLFRIWGGTNDRYFVDWVKHRIDKFGWLAGKHFVTFKTDGKRLGYILSLEAAIEAARGEPKGKGQQMLAYLTGIKKDLRKQRLSTRGKLSDFIPVKDVAPSDAFQPAAGGAGSSDQLHPNFPWPLPGDLETRVARLESTLRQLVQIHQQAADQLSAVLLGLAPVEAHPSGPVVEDSNLSGMNEKVGPFPVLSDSVPAAVDPAVSAPHLPPTPREHIRETINQYCTATSKTHEEAYSLLYHRLNRQYGVNVNALERQKNESLLEVCERSGHLTKIIAIVNSAEFQSVLETPKALLLEAR